MSVQKRLSYRIPFKLEVIKYAKEHGNRAAERHFGSPPTEKMIREWRKQEDQLQKADKSKHTFRGRTAKWPQIDVEMKEWITRHRNNGFSVSTKMIIYEAKRLAAEKGIEEFTGSPSWCYRFMRRCGLAMRTKTRIAQKMPKEYESKIVSFHKYVLDARKRNVLTRSHRNLARSREISREYEIQPGSAASDPVVAATPPGAPRKALHPRRGLQRHP
uniref:HTH CENPB-type domain-containing protein n=1 Tax=Anolis carolinensis TaxID=28377 RepID=L7MZP6_ANOCA